MREDSKWQELIQLSSEGIKVDPTKDFHQIISKQTIWNRMKRRKAQLNMLPCPHCHYELTQEPETYDVTHSDSGFYTPRYVGNGYPRGFDLFECQYCNKLINVKTVKCNQLHSHFVFSTDTQANFFEHLEQNNGS